MANSMARYLVNKKDWQTLAEKIEILSNDRDKRKMMGEASFLKIKKEFSAPVTAKKFAKVYQDVLIGTR